MNEDTLKNAVTARMKRLVEDLREIIPASAHNEPNVNGRAGAYIAAGLSWMAIEALAAHKADGTAEPNKEAVKDAAGYAFVLGTTLVTLSAMLNQAAGARDEEVEEFARYALKQVGMNMKDISSLPELPGVQDNAAMAVVRAYVFLDELLGQIALSSQETA